MTAAQPGIVPPKIKPYRSGPGDARDVATIYVFAVAVFALLVSVVAVGYGIRSKDESTNGSRVAHSVASDAPSAGAAMGTKDMDATMAAVTAKFPAKTAGTGAQDLAPIVLTDGTRQFELTTSELEWEVEPGRFVKAMAYNGTVPGPTLRVEPGVKVRVLVKNEMSESTAVHIHGIELPNSMDGVPDITQPPIKPGATYSYEFTAQNTPAVGMYHSHHNAAEQVPNGLAGAFLIGHLPIPSGMTLASEQVLMLNDAGTVGFTLNGKSFPATAPITANVGDWVLVHYLNEGVMAHPMHLHGMPQVVIAKDGFPLDQPYKADTVNVAPGERYSVLVQATTPGIWAWHCHILPHAERSTGMFGMVTALIVS